MKTARTIVLAATLIAGVILSGGEAVRRGTAIPAGADVVPLATLLADPGAFTGREVIMEGTVRKVCQFAGCWMTVGTDDGKWSMPVVFSRGAFKVPRSSAGSHAKIVGKVKIKDKKVSFIATGVDLASK